MSIYSSMYIGMSGMRANEAAIGVIGDNIANVNTIGFKGSRAVFADVLNQTVLGSAGLSQAGQGVALAGIQRLVTQGALLGTGVSTDLAVAGDGYFIVRDPSGQPFYTRNGQFTTDAEGYLQSIEGFRLQGYPADTAGVLSPRLGDLRIDGMTSPPVATTAVDIVANLNSNADFVLNFDPADPENTSSFSTSVVVHDSLGNAHEVEVYFTHDSEGQWSWHALVPTAETAGGDPASTERTEIGSGTLQFDTDGNLIDPQPVDVSAAFGAATPQTIVFDFGAGAGTKQWAGASTVVTIDADGHAAGDLSNVLVDEQGIITGSFTNGEQLILGQLALANFSAPDKLQALGHNRFSESLASGEPAIGQPGAGGRGDIFGGTLEQSNIDLTSEFTQLIVAQRGFQASSRTITTADEMLQEVVNLKR